MIVLAGSIALQYYFPNKKIRPLFYGDLDLVGTEKEIDVFIHKRFYGEKYNKDEILHDGRVRHILLHKRQELLNCEFRHIECNILDYEKDTILKQFYDLSLKYGTEVDGVIIPPLNLLFTNKIAHRFRKDADFIKKNFRKHHSDIMLMFNDVYNGKGIFEDHIESQYLDFYKAKFESYKGHKDPNLKVNKEEFFRKEEEFYEVDHDSIHVAIARFDNPVYLLFKADNEEVFCDKNKWNELSFEMKCHAAAEEATVLALERAYIPYRKRYEKRQINQYELRRKYELGLYMLASRISSGWFRDFVFYNLDEIKEHYYDSTYLDKFLEAEKNGIIKPFVRDK